MTSKFFEQPKHTDTAVTSKTDETILKAKEVKVKNLTKPEVEASEKVQANTMDVEEPIISPPVSNAKSMVIQIPIIENNSNFSNLFQSKARENSVTGFLFNHGHHGLPESLDVSMSTTGFEEGDPEYPHCLGRQL